VLQAGGTPTMTGITAAANVITFPAGIPGNYFISMGILAGTSATAWTAANWTPSAGASNINLFTNGTRDSTDELTSAAATAGTSVYMNATYTVGAAGGVITITPSTLVAPAGMDLWIVSLPSSVLTVDEREQLEIDELRERANVAENRLQRLEQMLLGAPVLPAIRRLQQEDSKEDYDDALPNSSSDELEKSVHIPKRVWSKMMGK